jgi:Na+/proline symporter
MRAAAAQLDVIPTEPAMSNARTAREWVGRLSGLVGVLFGIASIAAGASVLAGRDPGYLTFRPLLWFNVAMGLAYIVVGILAWRRAAKAWKAAGLIAGLNVLVLVVIFVLSRSGGHVAVDSVRAMLLRSAVWVLLTAGVAWSGRAADGRESRANE